jgi:hypothetical protein
MLRIALARYLLIRLMAYQLHHICGLAMTDSVRVQPDVHAIANQPVVWRTRYGGLVAIACIDDKAVAGISGPWDGKFALTWWDRPMPARQLELYDSLDEAKYEVEDWALRLRSGHAVAPPRGTSAETFAADRVTTLPGVPANAAAVRHTGLIERMFNLLPAVAKPRESAAATIERLRRERSEGDCDGKLADLHFSARG